MGIKSIRIQNFKSIRDSGEVELRPLNVLIGANGAGKSNFIGFFKLLNRLYERQLQLYVSRNGGANGLLYFGRGSADFLSGRIVFGDKGNYSYSFVLFPDQYGGFVFGHESCYSASGLSSESSAKKRETYLRDSIDSTPYELKSYFTSFKVFHFHDTSSDAKVKQPSNIADCTYLHEDANNLAAFLYRLQEEEVASFRMIASVIQSIAPFFDRFHLQPDESNPQQISLRWLEKESGQLFGAYELSDGTLRMICLTALLLQPNLPSTIIVDEPELGLHPFAIAKLAAMFISVSQKTQLIISTQSVTLLEYFTADDVIVVEQENKLGSAKIWPKQTVFKRQSEKYLREWLQEYTLGELWEKNVIGGRP